MKQLILIVLSLFLYGLPNSGIAAGNPDTGKSRAIICIGCHSVDGNSTNPIYPKLANQGEAYLIKQLRDFKSGERKEEHMTSMVEAISYGDIPDIAAYFSQQERKSEINNGPENRLGKKLYHSGQRKKAITACIQCHGTNAQGNPDLLYPSLAGQHADYLIKSLKAFRSAERQNDKNKTMRQIAARLSDSEIEAIAQYLATLP